MKRKLATLVLLPIFVINMFSGNLAVMADELESGEPTTATTVVEEPDATTSSEDKSDGESENPPADTPSTEALDLLTRVLRRRGGAGRQTKRAEAHHGVPVADDGDTVCRCHSLSPPLHITGAQPGADDVRRHARHAAHEDDAEIGVLRLPCR